MWVAAVGEVMICERESDNASDRYAVDVKISNYCWTSASKTNECGVPSMVGNISLV